MEQLNNNLRIFLLPLRLAVVAAVLQLFTSDFVCRPSNAALCRFAAFAIISAGALRISCHYGVGRRQQASRPLARYGPLSVTAFLSSGQPEKPHMCCLLAKIVQSSCVRSIRRSRPPSTPVRPYNRCRRRGATTLPVAPSAWRGHGKQRWFRPSTSHRLVRPARCRPHGK